MDAGKSSVNLNRQPLDPDKMFAALEEKIKNSIKTRASPKRTSVINFSNARYRFFLATNHPSNGHFLEVSYHTLS